MRATRIYQVLKRIAILDAQIQAETQIVFLLQGESKGFLWEMGGNAYISRRNRFLLVIVSWIIPYYMWPIIDSIFR